MISGTIMVTKARPGAEAIHATSSALGPMSDMVRPTERAVRLALQLLDCSPLPLVDKLDLEWELLQWQDYWRRRSGLRLVTATAP
jgi:hypothetical protein